MMSRILVIDDEHDVCATIAMILRVKGHNAVAVESGEIGLQEFGKLNFDLVIVDIFLQGVMSGVDVMRSLRDRMPNLPIIATSGVAPLDFLTQYPDLPNMTTLPKPFRPKELMIAIEAALQGSLPS
jgi:DNA-binding response OmpR family regulator